MMMMMMIRMMEVVVMTAAVRRAKLQSYRHRQQTNTQLVAGWIHFLSHNQQCQSTEGKPDAVAISNQILAP